MTKPSDTEPTAWAPDSRWAFPVIGCAWAWAVGWLPLWAGKAATPPAVDASGHPAPGFSPWIMIAFAAVAGLVAVWRARHAWPVRQYGDALREQGSLLAVVGAVALAVWLVRAGYTSPFAQAPLLVLMAAPLGLAYAALVSSAPRHMAAEAERTERMAEESDYDAVRAILDESNCADVKVFGVADTRAGYTVELGPDPTYPRRPKYNDVLSKLDDIELNLGIYWRHRDGTILEDGDVRLEAVAVDRWLMHVSTKHVLRETVPYHPNPAPTSFNMPIWLGLFEDGAAMRFALCGKHAKIVGATGGGKSVILNNIIARTLECRGADGRPDAFVWICASAKLVPLVYPWLLPWFERRTHRPPIDLIVGQDPAQCILFLQKVYDLVVDRNTRLGRKSKHTASADMPGAVVIVEEAKILALWTTPIDMGDGEMWTVSQLLNAICALARSAAVSILLVTQDGLYDSLGAWGSELMRNLTIRMCTVTLTASDGSNTLPALPGSVDTTTLRDKSMYLQNGIDETSRAMPGKAAKLDEDDVPPVALALSQALASPSARDIAAVGVDWYNGRWNADRLPELVTAAAGDELAPGGNGYEWPTVHAAPIPHYHRTEPEPVYTEPDAVEPTGEPFAWTTETDREFERIFGEPVADPEPPASTRGDVGPSASIGYDVDAHVERLHDIAGRIERESADMIAARDADDAPPVFVLPQPLRAVIAYLDAMDDPPEWIATSVLAAEVFGADVENAGVKLGQSLRRSSPNLSATDPRSVGDGRKARGYLVADLYRAAIALRDAQ